ncbi:MAG: hypothetical protein ACR2MM_00395 [Flavobacteriaceae bacterium]
MNLAPKSVLLIAVLLVFLLGCRNGVENSPRPVIDQEIDLPIEKSQDSSELRKPADLPMPEIQSPKRAKKNSGSDLDTLRPIKA